MQRRKKLSDSWLSRIYDDEEEDGRLFEYPSFYQNRGYLEDEVKSHPILVTCGMFSHFCSLDNFLEALKVDQLPLDIMPIMAHRFGTIMNA